MAGDRQRIAGMRCQESRLTFSPSLPADWESYTFKIRYQGALLKVAVTREQAEFVLEAGERIIFYLGGREVTLEGNGGMYVEKYKAVFLTGTERRSCPEKRRWKRP